jgi:hypothetical protein
MLFCHTDAGGICVGMTKSIPFLLYWGDTEMVAKILKFKRLSIFLIQQSGNKVKVN